jgi:HSP20 family protein
MSKETNQKERQDNESKAMIKKGDQASQETSLARRDEWFPSVLSRRPFAFMRRFSDEMDRLFADFGFGRDWLTSSFGRDLVSRGFGDFGEALWSPQVEMFERDGQLIVRADLPGLTRDDVKVEVTDNAINLSGERKSEREEKAEGYYRSERSYGSFYRSIPLPEGVNADDANATFKNGVLEIAMAAPQRAARGRRLEITEGQSETEQARGKATGR